MKKIILTMEARLANWKSNRGYKNNICAKKQSILDQLADRAQRNLENYLDEKGV